MGGEGGPVKHVSSVLYTDINANGHATSSSPQFTSPVVCQHVLVA